jgi:peptidoglycan/LPS O-acetylase OafA/YrhL
VNPRIQHLDGLRGWAALSVLLFHIFWEVFGALYPVYRSRSLGFVLNGPLAVYVFFIISGDALLAPFLAKKDIEAVVRISRLRYARLTTPIALSSLICMSIMMLDLNFNIEAAKIVNRDDWLALFANFQATLPGALVYSTYGVYFTHNAATSYNPFLWTMSIEMLGSFMIFIFALQIKNTKRPINLAAFMAAMFFLAKSYYSLFFIGATFSLLRRQGFFNFCTRPTAQATSWLMIAAVIASCIASDNIAHDNFKTNFFRATVFTLAVNINTIIKNALESRFSRFLGKISFPLYLIHFSILISLTSYLILYCHDSGILSQESALAIGVLSAVASLIGAIIFRLIEFKSLALVYKLISRV